MKNNLIVLLCLYSLVNIYSIKCYAQQRITKKLSVIMTPYIDTLSSPLDSLNSLFNNWDNIKSELIKIRKENENSILIDNGYFLNNNLLKYVDSGKKNIQFLELLNCNLSYIPYSLYTSDSEYYKPLINLANFPILYFKNTIYTEPKEQKTFTVFQIKNIKIGVIILEYPIENTTYKQYESISNTIKYLRNKKHCSIVLAMITAPSRFNNYRLLEFEKKLHEECKNIDIIIAPSIGNEEVKKITLFTHKSKPTFIFHINYYHKKIINFEINFNP